MRRFILQWRQLRGGTRRGLRRSSPSERPRKVRPSKGVLRDLLGESAAWNVHLCSVEKTVKSAGSSAAIFRSMPRTRAGPVVNSSTRRASEILPGMHEFAQPERERRLEACDAEWRAVEFDVLACGVMRRVVRGYCVDASIGQAFGERVAIGT